MIRLLNREVVANVTIVRGLQWTCFGASVLVLVLSIWTLAHSDLSPKRIVLGLVATSLGPLFFLAMGLVLPVIAGRERA